MTKVLVTLDFDGVISPIDHDRDFSIDPGFELFRLGAFSCAISKSTISALRQLKLLSERYPDQLVVRWATSWVDLTERFEALTEGAVPSFPWLPVSGSSKAQAIVEEALELEPSLVLVFEDSGSALRELRKRWKRTNDLGNVELATFEPKLTEGLTKSSMGRARKLILKELTRKAG